MCLLPLQSLLALAAPTCGLPSAASVAVAPGHPEAALEGHHGHHAVMAHAAAHEADVASDAHALLCPHAGLHPTDNGAGGPTGDQADCDGLLHCLGSHLVPLVRIPDVHAASLSVRDLLVPGRVEPFRSALTEPLHRPPIARAA